MRRELLNAARVQNIKASKPGRSPNRAKNVTGVESNAGSVISTPGTSDEARARIRPVAPIHDAGPRLTARRRSRRRVAAGRREGVLLTSQRCGAHATRKQRDLHVARRETDDVLE